MLEKLFDRYQIILASGSPRRQQFLKEANIPFHLQLFPVEEIYPPELQREEITTYLSDLKSKPFDKILNDNELVITSDTIVWHQDKALGKPKNTKDAVRMLQQLSGDSHEVITSISIKGKCFQEVVSDTTKVYFKKLSLTEITYYIQNFKPFDKAGSYGIQEWLGQIAVEKIEGSYTNVMGLPMHKLYEVLKNIEDSKM